MLDTSLYSLQMHASKADMDTAFFAFRHDVSQCAIRDKGSYLEVMQSTYGNTISRRPSDLAWLSSSNIWARNPEHFHVDAGALVSQFFVREILSEKARGIPVTLHLDASANNDLAIRFLQELSHDLPQERPAWQVKPKSMRMFHDEALHFEIRRSFGAFGSLDPRPFAVSATAERLGDQYRITPNLKIWFEERGRATPRELSYKSTKETRHCGILGHSYLTSSECADRLILPLSDIGHPENPEPFEVVCMPFGVLLLSHFHRDTAYHKGIERAVRAYVPKDLSNHQIMHTIDQLERAANAVLHRLGRSPGNLPSRDIAVIPPA